MSVAPGWYADNTGQSRWWDGRQWGPYAPQQSVQQPVEQSRDRAQYVRQQTGHSLTKHILLGWLLCYIPTVYYAISPNHYFHL